MNKLMYTFVATRKKKKKRKKEIDPFLDTVCPFRASRVTRLNSSLSEKGSIVLIVLNKSGPIKLYYPRVFPEGEDPLISTCVTSKQIIIWKKCFRSMAATRLNLRLRICRFQKENKRFSSGKSK